MKTTAKEVNLTIALFAFALFSMVVPLQAVLADDEGKMAAYNRNVDKDIQDLEMKINEVKEDYKEDGIAVEQKIKAYEDKIAEIKRESSRDVNEMKAEMRNNPSDNDQTSRLGRLRKDFNEWRLKRALRNYEDKIDNVRYKALNEMDTSKKIELEEKVQKLEAKYQAASAKLKDLRMTNGDNWDRIERELDASLKEIDREYDALQDARS